MNILRRLAGRIGYALLRFSFGGSSASYRFKDWGHVGSDGPEVRIIKRYRFP